MRLTEPTRPSRIEMTDRADDDTTPFVVDVLFTQRMFACVEERPRTMHASAVESPSAFSTS